MVSLSLPPCSNPKQYARYGVPDEGMVGRCKLDPGLKAPPGFKSSNLMKINFTFNLRNLILSLSSRRRYGLGH